LSTIEAKERKPGLMRGEGGKNEGAIKEGAKNPRTGQGEKRKSKTKKGKADRNPL